MVEENKCCHSCIMHNIDCASNELGECDCQGDGCHNLSCECHQPPTPKEEVVWGEPFRKPAPKEECEHKTTTRTNEGNGEVFVETCDSCGKIIKPAHKEDVVEGWESKLYGLLYDEYGDIGRNFNIKAFISQEIKKAKEERDEEIIEMIEETIKNMADLTKDDNIVYEAQHTAYSIALQDLINKLTNNAQDS